MPDPDGSLTPAQFEILDLLWESDGGLTVAEIWEAIRAERDVGRTTMLNLVDRLEKRGWLKRQKIEGVFRYEPAVQRGETEVRMASEFVGDFFGGSPSQLLLSLLGSKRVSKAELDRLKTMLQEHETNRASRKKKG